MNNNKSNYIPGIYGFKLKNLHDRATDYIISSVGTPTTENLALYKDRSKLFGIDHFDTDDLNDSINNLTSLSQKIVKRNHQQVFINSSEHTFDRVAESILELYRYPLLVCLNDTSDLDNLQTVHRSFRNVFNSDSFCSLYRKENSTDENKEFNEYIKYHNLNLPLAETSKIVYTSINKMSKTLIKSSWKPAAAILMDSVRHTKMSSYLSELDLVIHYDTDISPFARSGSKNSIERL